MILLIKISGEGLSQGEEKYTESVLESIAEKIKTLLADGHKISMVVGGGNLFRGRDLSGTLNINRSTGDYIGMLATVQNALVVRDFFESKGIAARVSSSIAMPQVCEEYIPNRAKRHMEKGRVVIFAAGLGIPYFSTDSCAAQRALEMQADLLVMAKNGVDGLYSADPKKDSSAKFVKQITATQVIEQDLKVADLSAMGLAKENGLTIKIVSSDQIDQALDPEVGSTVTPE
ncbi:MAG: UMP kinase [Candidatus Pacebacteria bacterium]|nr:UMP kinase [Candidatus Paceibacterota bacterium]